MILDHWENQRSNPTSSGRTCLDTKIKKDIERYWTGNQTCNTLFPAGSTSSPVTSWELAWRQTCVQNIRTCSVVPMSTGLSTGDISTISFSMLNPEALPKGVGFERWFSQRLRIIGIFPTIWHSLLLQNNLIIFILQHYSRLAFSIVHFDIKPRTLHRVFHLRIYFLSKVTTTMAPSHSTPISASESAPTARVHENILPLQLEKNRVIPKDQQVIFKLRTDPTNVASPTDICLIYTSKLTSESSPIERLLSSVEKEQAQNNYWRNTRYHSNSLRFETDWVIRIVRKLRW